MSDTPDLETVIEQGDLVYSVAWDSGGPGGGADAERIYRLGEAYVVCPSDDAPMGPYPTLVEAVKEAELDFVTEATTEVFSSEMGAKEVAGLLRCEEEPGFWIEINGEEWELDEDGRFVSKR